MSDRLTAEDAARMLRNDEKWNNGRNQIAPFQSSLERHLAAALAEHKDCVSRADLLRGYIPADVARAECAAEVTRLREALQEAEEVVRLALTALERSSPADPRIRRTGVPKDGP